MTDELNDLTARLSAQIPGLWQPIGVLESPGTRDIPCPHRRFDWLYHDPRGRRRPIQVSLGRELDRDTSALDDEIELLARDLGWSIRGRAS